MVRQRLLLAAAATVGLFGLGPIEPASAFRKIVIQPVAANAPAGSVHLPHVMQDAFGVNWDVQPDGSIGDGGNDLYDGGGRLAVNDQAFNGQQSATWNPADSELAFAPQNVGPLVVSRRVAVNAAGGWCRFTETVQNPTAAAVATSVRVNFDLGGGIQDAQNVVDPKRKSPLGVVVFDGQRALGMLGGGPGGRVVCQYVARQNTDQCDLIFQLDVPPRQTVSVVHFQAMRPTSQAATEFLLTATEKQLLAGVPREIRKTIVNFRQGDATLESIDLPRAELQDIVELRSGDQYRGTLLDAAFTLDCFHGKVQVPAERVIGMVTAGRYQPTQLLVTVDGEIIGGKLVGDALNMELSSGQKVAVPLSAIGRVGCRKRPNEPEEFKLQKPVVLLRDGQRLFVDPPDEAIAVATMYGDLKLPPAAVASIAFAGDDQVMHRLTLRDGSTFAGIVGGAALPLRFAGAAAGTDSSPAAKVPLSAIGRLQLLPGELEAADNAPMLTMSNGDVLVGVVSGVLEVQTGFDRLKVNGGEIQSIRAVEPTDTGRVLPGEVTITLWGGATVSGRITTDRLAVLLKGDVKLDVPVSAIGHYDQPEPAAPATMVERIGTIVAQLSDPDWKKRERAADQLRSIGAAAAVVLRDMRDGQPPETQKQIDTILKSIADAGDRNPPALNKDAAHQGEFNKDELLPRIR